VKAEERKGGKEVSTRSEVTKEKKKKNKISKNNDMK